MTKNKKHFTLLIFIGLLSLVVAGCGSKSQESVIKKIEGTLGDMNGYKVEAQMTMKTGQEERSYEVDVWYKKGQEDFYRVGLENEEEEGGQVILKNEEGVFVLTPALKKSFKFQTDWPENSSQPYLYQSLVNDVLIDKEATFTDTETHYVFLTKTNYQNSTNLPYQEVSFDKKSYTPTGVKIMDKDKNVLVEVTFDGMDMNPDFAKSDFDREAILEETLADTSVSNMDQLEEISVMYPLKTLGAELVEKQEVTIDEGERVIMTFKGERNFTLIQERTDVVPTSGDMVQEVVGDVVNLGFSVGAITNNTIEWNYNGTNFYLASEDMTMEELIDVASSIEGQEIK
ncbi:outer membrane lipoprotein carrier protein LolA [Pseudogracilibacillus sp. SE30717A]|uniref:LolA family protein n=1 Tax=Pseudogracilibacillus sp. SE30717A TaxID=3098293 RepID=UPI00300E2F48